MNVTTTTAQRILGQTNASATIDNGGNCLVRFDPAIHPEYAKMFPDGYLIRFGQLCTDGDSNFKLAKTSKRYKIRSFGLSMAPAKYAGLLTMCSHAVDCVDSCLFFTGFAAIHSSINASRTAKTIAFQLQRQWFLDSLRCDVSRRVRSAEREGVKLAARPNMLTDIKWEIVAPWLFTDFPTISWYDYTKVPKRKTPENYHLTFSVNSRNESVALAEYKRGINLSVVFYNVGKFAGNQSHRQQLPKTWRGIRVFDATQHDYRPDDPRGIAGLVLLAANNENRQAAIDSGFAKLSRTKPLTAAEYRQLRKK